MSIIKDTFFGGAEKDAARAQQAALEDSQDFVRKGIADGKADINRLYPDAQNMMRDGFQGALDVFGQYMPEQASAFQQGNMGAQNAILSALPQMNNAVLGNPIDYSGMQPQLINFDSSIFSQQLPPSMQAQQPQPQTTNPQQNILSMLQNYRGLPFGGSGSGAFGSFGRNQIR